MSLILVLFGLSVLFFVPYYVRFRRVFYKLKLIGNIVSIKEGTKLVPQQYGNWKYYYPIIEYEYHYKDRLYKGKTKRLDIKRLMVSDVNNMGEPNNEELFYWRDKSIGDEISILIKEEEPNRSIIDLESNKTYKSESKGYLFLTILFLFLGFLVMYFEYGSYAST